jgi:hypothetical protein
VAGARPRGRRGRRDRRVVVIVAVAGPVVVVVAAGVARCRRAGRDDRRQRRQRACRLAPAAHDELDAELLTEVAGLDDVVRAAGALDARAAAPAGVAADPAQRDLGVGRGVAPARRGQRPADLREPADGRRRLDLRRIGRVREADQQSEGETDPERTRSHDP